MNVEKQLFQWDTSQKVVAVNMAYVDFVLGSDQYRVSVSNGKASIPDEVLQVSGNHVCYGMKADGTYEAFGFYVYGRPKPPSYAYTATEKTTFDALVARVNALVESGGGGGTGGMTQTAADARYAAKEHTHTGYAASEHTHTGYASTNHSHTEYAVAEHSHSGYASTSHTHTEYASASHSHSEYASAEHNHDNKYQAKGSYASSDHTHTGYASTSHTHSYNSLSDKPTIPEAVTDDHINDLIDERVASSGISGVSIKRNVLRKKHLVIFGDSLSDPNVAGKWVAKFQAKASGIGSIRNYARGFARWTCFSDTTHDVVNTGNSSDHNNVIWNQYNRLVKDVEDGGNAPDVILIFAGTNDAIQDVTVGTASNVYTGTQDTTMSNLTTMHASMRYVCDLIYNKWSDCKVVLMSHGQTIGVNNTAFRDAVEDACMYMGLPFIDGYKTGIVKYRESIERKYLAADGIHPNDDGAELVADYIYGCLQTMPQLYVDSCAYGASSTDSGDSDDSGNSGSTDSGSTEPETPTPSEPDEPVTYTGPSTEAFGSGTSHVLTNWWDVSPACPAGQMTYPSNETSYFASNFIVVESGASYTVTSTATNEYNNNPLFENIVFRSGDATPSDGVYTFDAASRISPHDIDVWQMGNRINYTFTVPSGMDRVCLIFYSLGSTASEIREYLANKVTLTKN